MASVSDAPIGYPFSEGYGYYGRYWLKDGQEIPPRQLMLVPTRRIGLTWLRSTGAAAWFIREIGKGLLEEKDNG